MRTPEELIGQTLNGYEIQSEIGRGGMAAVFQARQITMKRSVALKVLLPTMAIRPHQLQRFAREAQVIAQLEHPHIVPIYEIGTFGEMSYVSMRLLTGGSLGQRLEERYRQRRGLMPIPEVLELMDAIARAMDYAHSKGIVHRDIKPTNILFDQQDNPFLTDFGIAKIIRDEMVTQLTQQGAMLGTPLYMSPEQWRGEMNITPAADQYALAIVVFQLLTGRLPFEGAGGKQPSFYQLVELHTKQAPPPASQLMPSLPPAVDGVLIQALAKHPAQRFPSTRAFVQTLRQALLIPQYAPPQPPPYQAAPPYQPTPPWPTPPAPTPSTPTSARPPYQAPTPPQLPYMTPPPPTPTSVKRQRAWGLWGMVILLSVIVVGLVGVILSGVLDSESPSSSAAPTATPIPKAIQVATQDCVNNNAEWEAYIGIEGVTERDFDGVTMVLVPCGSFMMGSLTDNADEKPRTEQIIEKPFWIDKTEVTNAAYGSKGLYSGDDLPRERVSWVDAVAFCEGRGGRLPSEAEWEYAARGPSNWRYPWGNSFDETQLNYYETRNSYSNTAPVGSFPDGASWVGALDMAGNVWEWTSSSYSDYPYDATDGREDTSLLSVSRVLRGGGWSSSENTVYMTNRTYAGSVYVGSNNGFRCVRDYDG